MLTVGKHSHFDAAVLSLRPLPCSCTRCGADNPLDGVLHEHFICASKNKVLCSYNCAGVSVHTWLEVNSKDKDYMDNDKILPTIRETLKYKYVCLRVRGRYNAQNNTNIAKKTKGRNRRKTVRVNV